MKKILLVASVFSVTLFAKAQTQTQTCTVGYTATGIYEDFSSDTDPANEDNSGVFPWGEETLAGDDNPAFQAMVSRNATNGTLDARVTQGQNGYVPFGISFGDNATTSGPFTIDLSNDATYSVTVKNNSADTTIKFRMTIQDINDNVLDTDPKYSTDTWGNAYKYTIEVVLAPGETKTLTAGSQGSGGTSLSGTYTGAAYADYVAGQYSTTFDFTKVKNILFTVVNNTNTGTTTTPGYQPLAISNLSVSISDVRVGSGACVAGLFNSVDNRNKLSISPNPSSSLTKVSYNGNVSSDVTVNVSDAMGHVVRTAKGNGKEADFNVDGLTKGIYFVTVYVDGTPVSVDKLVVE